MGFNTVDVVCIGSLPACTQYTYIFPTRMDSYIAVVVVRGGVATNDSDPASNVHQAAGARWNGRVHGRVPGPWPRSVAAWW